MDQLKICTKCQEAKPFTEFYKQKGGRGGLRSVCKKCTNFQSKISKAKNPHYKERQRNTKREQYQNDPEYRSDIIERNRQYRQSEAGKSASRNRYNSTKGKYNWAHETVYNAIKQGRLPPISAQKCTICNKEADNYHHHNGYDQDHILDVIPLCLECHRIEHRVD
jgi:hypothetical protein